MKPFFSIIIPAYNSEKTIGSLIKSLHACRSQVQFEVLIIDDGSSDKTRQIVEAECRSDSRFSIFIQANKGPGAARNVGIERAIGEYVLFIDADDQLEDNGIDRLYSELVKLGYPELLCFDYQAYRNGRPVPRKGITPHSFPQERESSGLKCLEYMHSLNLGYFSWAFAYRRNLLSNKKIRYDENHRLLEDMLFFHNLLPQVSHVNYLSSPPIYMYTQRDSSLSLRPSPENILDGIEAIGLAGEMMRRCGQYTSFCPSAVNMLLYLYSCAIEMNPEIRQKIKGLLLQFNKHAVKAAVMPRDRAKIIMIRLGIWDLYLRMK